MARTHYENFPVASWLLPRHMRPHVAAVYAFARAAEIAPSPSWGLNFCMGCWSEMGGHENVLRGIRYFGGRGQIFYGHFRDVIGEA